MNLTWMDLIKVTVAYRIPYRILTSNLHQTVYVANYHAWVDANDHYVGRNLNQPHDFFGLSMSSPLFSCNPLNCQRGNRQPKFTLKGLLKQCIRCSSWCYRWLTWNYITCIKCSKTISKDWQQKYRPNQNLECEMARHLVLVFQWGGRLDPWQPSEWQQHAHGQYAPCWCHLPVSYIHTYVCISWQP